MYSSLYLMEALPCGISMLNSGVHATITGVLLAFVIPFGNGGENILVSTAAFFYKPVAFFYSSPICNSKHLYSINSIGMRVKSPTRLVLCLVW
jgi:Na+/H+ antiporter NhaA